MVPLIRHFAFLLAFRSRKIFRLSHRVVARFPLVSDPDLNRFELTYAFGSLDVLARHKNRPLRRFVFPFHVSIGQKLGDSDHKIRTVVQMLNLPHQNGVAAESRQRFFAGSILCGSAGTADQEYEQSDSRSAGTNLHVKSPGPSNTLKSIPIPVFRAATIPAEKIVQNIFPAHPLQG